MRTARTVLVKDFGKVEVVRCDSPGDVYFDVFGEDGRCLNEKRPFWSEPTDEEVRQCLALSASLAAKQSANPARRSGRAA